MLETDRRPWSHHHHQRLPSNTLLASTPFNSVSNYSPLCLTYALLTLPSPPLSLPLPTPSRLPLPSLPLHYPPLLLSSPLKGRRGKRSGWEEKEGEERREGR